MNLKESKKSNILVSIFIDSLKNKEMLQETFFSISKQTYPIDLLVMHNLGDDDLKALVEIVENPTIIARSQVDGKTEEETIKSDGTINYVLAKTELTEFPKLFNFMFNVASNNKYEFCSIIERNDIVGLQWYRLANEFNVENPEIDMFFPIIRNTANGVFSNLMNEAPWAEGLAEEAGKIDLSLLNRFNCIIPIGAIFKIKSLEEYSEVTKDGTFLPVKESMKLSHYYEFLMRMIYNDLKGMSVQRIGYEHRIFTATEFNEYSCKIPQNLTTIPKEKGGYLPAEAQYWLDLSKKEYFFDEDRKKLYEPSIKQ